MRRRPPTLLTATAAVVILAPLIAGCEAKVYGDTATPAGPQLTVIAPMGTRAPLPESPPDEPAATFSGLDARARQATADAAKAGADVTITVLDRNTGQIVTNGNNKSMPIASVVKLFIADDLLLQEARGQTQLSPDDRQSFDAMLRSSDDSAAEVFWNRSGGHNQRTFMFLCEVALGKVHKPRTFAGSYPVRSSNTTWVEPGQGGVMNHECIVYDTSQINLKYLAEFGAK